MTDTGEDSPQHGCTMRHQLLSGQPHKVLQPPDGRQAGPLISRLCTVHEDLGQLPKVCRSAGLHIDEKLLQGTCSFQRASHLALEGCHLGFPQLQEAMRAAEHSHS